MKIAKNRTKYIFCLEGDWTDDLRKKESIINALKFLDVNYGIKYIHRNCSTYSEFEYRLNEYKKAIYKNYSICYLAFHGEED